MASGCSEEINREVQAESLARERTRAAFVGKFNSAKILSGKVHSSVVSENGLSASIMIDGTNGLKRFDYRHQGGFGLSDIGLTDIPLYYPNGSEIHWREGYRPHDSPKPQENGIFAEFSDRYSGVK